MILVSPYFVFGCVQVKFFTRRGNSAHNSFFI